MLEVFKYKGALPDRLLNRSQLADEAVNASVKEILAQVRQRGDEALLDYTRQFDKVALDALRVSQSEIDSALAQVPENLMEALRQAAENIRAFHEKQKRQSMMDTQPGRTLGQLILPLESVGIYVPGGTAAYPSSVLMNAIPAKVAGVSRIVMTTPPMRDGSIYYLTLAAAQLAGVDEIYKVGGAQAIGALAYGTQSIQPVCKIVGPGNIYVANAKREVFGTVGIDMIAGPSEVLVVADDSANPHYVAADLLSQAEHDTLAAVVLVTPSRKLADAVNEELTRQLATLPKQEIAGASLKQYGAAILVQSLTEAMEAANRFAPEHLELCVQDPYALLPQVKNAGSVFLGHFSPEPLGDYLAGPNHVLPTSGTARFSSPLGVDDFTKRTSFVCYARQALQEVAVHIDALATAEGLEAHARAVRIRMEE